METINEAKIKIKFYKKIADLKSKYKEKREFDKKYENLRINSIDFLRGILVIFTIFLISQGLEGNIEKAFVISKWNGFNIADILLPFFLLIMGMSIPFYVKKNHQEGKIIAEISRSIFKRAVIIFVIGLIYSILFLQAKANVRLTGPYQLIAINYLLCSMIYIGFLKKKIKNNALTYIFISLGAILSLIFTIVAFKNGAGIEKSVFTSVDKSVLKGFASSAAADPEGLLATFSAIPITMYGISIGCILNKKPIEHKKYVRYKRTHMIKEHGFSKENLLIDMKSRFNLKSIKSFLSNYYRINNEAKKIVNLFVLGLLMYILSAITGAWIPMNRNVFSLPFVLRCCAIMFFVIDIFYILFDIIKLDFGTKLVRRIGQNALFVTITISAINGIINLIKIKSIYTGTWLHFNNWFTTDFILPITGIEKASTVYALVLTVIWVLLLNLLDKYDIKISI